MNLEAVRLLDSLCANAWPPRESVAADGWVLRAAGGISLRANSVWPRETVGGVPVAERMASAEAFYAQRALTPRFQISPASEPPELEVELERRGYTMHTTTDVMVAKIEARRAHDRLPTVELLERPEEDWSAVMLESAPDPLDARGRLAIIDSIRLPRRHALIRVGDEPVAIGLATVERGWLGLFAMRTHPRFRRRGLARAVVGALLAWGARAGAFDAFLQVESENPAAIALYSGVGFRRLYSYSYFTPLSAP